jgi:DNA primase
MSNWTERREALKKSVPLEKLVSKTVNLEAKGLEHVGLCPFCGDSRASFYVVSHKGFYHCFCCGSHGDAVDFVVFSKNISDNEAIEYLETA